MKAQKKEVLRIGAAPLLYRVGRKSY